MKILSIESSCDETAAAVVEDGRRVLSGIVNSQIETHKKYGGVVPEIASRAHTEAISHVVKEALEKAGTGIDGIDAIAVTYTPGLVGALLAGVSFAKGLSLATGKPLIGVNHMRGHIAAAYPENPDLEGDFYALVISGGHTSIIRAKSYTEFELVGMTRDDAAGYSLWEIVPSQGEAHLPICLYMHGRTFPISRGKECLHLGIPKMRSSVEITE